MMVLHMGSGVECPGGLNQTKSSCLKPWGAITLPSPPPLILNSSWGTALGGLDLELKLYTLASLRSWASRVGVVFLSEPGSETKRLNCVLSVYLEAYRAILVLLEKRG